MVELNPLNQQANVVKVNAASFAAKYRSKVECYSFMTVKVRAYLPSYETITLYFLRDLMSGKSKCKQPLFRNCLLADIKCDDIKVIFCPQYEGLSIKAMLQESAKYPQIAYYLPEAKELDKLPRQWVANVIYTIEGEPFAAWVEQQIARRNSKIVLNNNKEISMDADVYAAFMSSEQISSKCCCHLKQTLTNTCCCLA